MQHNKPRSVENEDVAAFVDIIQFLRVNSKFLGATTLVLSAIAIIFSLLTTPKQYQKQLTLLVTTSSIPLTLQTLPPGRDVNQTGSLAVEFLESAQLDPITVKARYDLDTQKINLNLLSPDASALNKVSPKVVKQLKKSFQEPLRQTLQTSLITTDIQLKKQQLVLAELNRQIAKFPPTNKVGLEALQTQRAQQITIAGSLKFDKQYLEQAQKNIAAFAANTMSVEILSESGVQQTRSTGQILVVAAIASFIVAVLAAAIRHQIPRLKNELSKRKIHRL